MCVCYLTILYENISLRVFQDHVKWLYLPLINNCQDVHMMSLELVSFCGAMFFVFIVKLMISTVHWNSKIIGCCISSSGNKCANKYPAYDERKTRWEKKSITFATRVVFYEVFMGDYTNNTLFISTTYLKQYLRLQSRDELVLYLNP